MDLKSKIILISGPTASGKSNFSIKLAKKINGEIINADSMQVYKELKILSARPIKKDQKKIKHHLYGFQNVKKNFSTGHWLKLVNKKIKELRKRGKVPILVGGTGLYFKALTEGLVKIPNIPIKLRNKIYPYSRVGLHGKTLQLQIDKQLAIDLCGNSLRITALPLHESELYSFDSSSRGYLAIYTANHCFIVHYRCI